MTFGALPHRALEAAVVDAACAVVEGRVADCLRAEGSLIPRWAWLNALAHGSPPQLRDLARQAGEAPGDPWADAANRIALSLVEAGGQQASQVQTAVLVPLELQSLLDRDPPSSPERVVAVVSRRLHPSHWPDRDGPPP